MLGRTKPREGGFSLLELILVIAILAVIMTVVVVLWSGYTRAQDLETATRETLTMLREAQGNAVARVNDANWGVRITNNAPGTADTAELFWNASGTTYAGGTVARTLTFPSGADFTSPVSERWQDIVFNERFGTVLGGGSGGGAGEWVSYRDITTAGLRAAQYIGGGSQTTCGPPTGSADWKCVVVDDSATINYGGDHPAILDPSGRLWIAYQEGTGNRAFRIAQYVGDGSNASGGMDDCENNPEPTNWRCFTLEDRAGVLGDDSGIGFDSLGRAFVIYNDRTSDAIRVAQYVGGGLGGSSCEGNTDTYPADWKCFILDNPTEAINETFGVMFDASNNPWVSYKIESGVGALKVARYVGSGGTGCDANNDGTTGDPPDWKCFYVDNPVTNVVGDNPYTAIDALGNIWIMHQDVTAKAVKVAQYVGDGSGGSSCDGNTDTVPSNWKCFYVYNSADTVGNYGGISFDSSGRAWITFNNVTTAALWAAQYVGGGLGGSSCEGNTDTVPANWRCFVVDDLANAVEENAPAFDSRGNVRIAYQVSSADEHVRIAQYDIGNGGGCTNNGDVPANWRCYVLHNPAGADVGSDAAISYVNFPGNSSGGILRVVLSRTDDSAQTRTITIRSQGGISVE